MTSMPVEFGTILGGFLSGVLGGAVAVEYRTRREKMDQTKDWYDKTIRLAGRIEQAQSQSYTVEEAQYAESTCAGVLKTLAKHLSDAPNAIDEDIVSEAEELVAKCEFVTLEHNHFSDDMNDQQIEAIHERMVEASNKATEVANLARQEREAVRLV
jgi:heterodisulfide reductase subunit A-like polyferredoxin